MGARGTMQNRFVDKFRVRYPLCLAGMAMIATPELVAAVSNAGGLGILGTGPVPPEWLRSAVADVRSRTNKPFAVNLIHEMTAFGPLTTAEHIRVCAEEKVDLVVFFWQPPEAEWADSLDRAGVPFVVTVGSADTAERAAKLPLSGLMLQGIDAGGHVKAEMRLFDLVQLVRDEFPDQILIGAGGLATADDVRSILKAGADAVCLGTRFVASQEANAHSEYKNRIIRAKATDTIITKIFGPEWPDVPMRVIRNQATDGQITGLPVGTTELFGQTYEMPPNSAVLPMRNTAGNFDLMCLAAGESVEGIHEVQSVAEIVDSFLDSWSS
jgi:NAD(P)H-dependent flavin oxidoreductase YrpB (nitropropane dioxygenase family)